MYRRNSCKVLICIPSILHSGSREMSANNRFIVVAMNDKAIAA